MTELSTTSKHGLEMGVQVIKRTTGKVQAPVSEHDLEPFGFGTDPLLAVERYKQHMEDARLRAVASGESPDLPSWLDTEVIVYPDEDFGHLLQRFHLMFDAVLVTTRKEKALRLFAQYLLDIANGKEPDAAPFVGGTGVQLVVES